MDGLRDAGKVQKDDVLISNFNNSHNLQGLGSTIVDYRPSTKQLSTFATIPRQLLASQSHIEPEAAFRLYAEHPCQCSPIDPPWLRLP